MEETMSYPNGLSRADMAHIYGDDIVDDDGLTLADQIARQSEDSAEHWSDSERGK